MGILFCFICFVYPSFRFGGYRAGFCEFLVFSPHYFVDYQAYFSPATFTAASVIVFGMPMNIFPGPAIRALC